MTIPTEIKNEFWKTEKPECNMDGIKRLYNEWLNKKVKIEGILEYVVDKNLSYLLSWNITDRLTFVKDSADNDKLKLISLTKCNYLKQIDWFLSKEYQKLIDYFTENEYKNDDFLNVEIYETVEYKLHCITYNIPDQSRNFTNAKKYTIYILSKDGQVYENENILYEVKELLSIV